MKLLAIASVFTLLCTPALVSAISSTYLACQIAIPNLPPPHRCPTGTIFVSANTSDPYAQFHRVQDAIDSLPEGEPAIILIGAGEYHETLNITRKAPLTLLGQLPTIAGEYINRSWTSTTPRNYTAPNLNLVQIWDNKYVQTGMDDADSAVLLIAPSYNASLIGAGPTGAPLQPLFGNLDFKAYNIDFQNRAASYAISQALVTDISYSNASFYGCSFASYQDTWYTGRNASTFVVDSIIFGQTDYLFGFGTAWFQNIILANRACGGGIAAWKGTNQTDAPGNRYGAYIADSKIIRSPDANATTITAGQCYLGRPWNDLATTVYLRTYMDASIRPAGWTPFNSARPTIMNTTFYAEYDSTGLGGNLTDRVAAEHFLTKSEVEASFTLEKVFLEPPKWIDYTYTYGKM